MLKLFLENGQDVNAIGFRGVSILILCVLHKNTEGIRHLLNNSQIDLNIKLTQAVSHEGVEAYADERAIDIAKREKMTEIIEMLEEVTTSNIPYSLRSQISNFIFNLNVQYVA